jgi:hypothetical protein
MTQVFIAAPLFRGQKSKFGAAKQGERCGTSLFVQFDELPFAQSDSRLNFDIDFS